MVEIRIDYFDSNQKQKKKRPGCKVIIPFSFSLTEANVTMGSPVLLLIVKV